jgi:hypothetical protein
MFVGFVSDKPLFSFCEDTNDRHVFGTMSGLIFNNYRMSCMYDIFLIKLRSLLIGWKQGWQLGIFVLYDLIQWYVIDGLDNSRLVGILK